MGAIETRVATKTEMGTHRLGTLLGGYLEKGDFVALMGELGTGKTTLVQGIAIGMGVASETYVRSPTFVLLHTYQGRCPVFHLDLYRIKDSSEIEELDYREMFYGGGVTVVEWAEKILAYLPREHLKITLHHKDERTREIRFVPSGNRYELILKNLRQGIRELCSGSDPLAHTLRLLH